MNRIYSEIERLTMNAAAKREGLLLTGLKKSGRRKALTVLAGVLALSSAGVITAVATKLVGDSGVQMLAAFVAAVSGTSSLLIQIYYSDEDVLSMLSGSAEYLALRENVYRLVIHPNLSDEDRFSRLVELQDEYARLDKAYSKYFTMDGARNRSGPSLAEFSDAKITRRANSAAFEEMNNLHREFENIRAGGQG